MTRSLRPAGAALVAVVALLGSLLVSQGTAHAAGPVVTVTSPLATDAVKGVWQLSADLTTDPGDAFTSAVLQLDGQPLPVTDTCSGSDQPCTLSIQHDFTGDSGTHTVTVLATTGLVTTPVSDPVTFTVTSPGPFASFTSPAAGSTRKGRFNVSFKGETDPSQTGEFVQSIELLRGATLATATSLNIKQCGGTQTSCPQTFQVDATSLPDGPLTLWAVTTSTAPRTATASLDLTVSNPPPTTSISSPAGGATVSGTVIVAATASTDPSLSEVPAQIQLLADGTVVDTQPCVAATPDCSLQLTWDATGLTGDHVLTTVVTTSVTARTATSSPVTVTVTTPPFDVAITSPVHGAVVAGAGATAVSSGTVAVSVTASTDITQNEFPAQLELLVDGFPVDSAACLGSPEHACNVTLHWNARTAAGLHRLAARITTSRSHTATSASISVFARSGSKVAFFSNPISTYGGYTTVRGRVASTTSGQPLVGSAVRLVLVPAVGTARTVIVRTGIGGVFSVRTRYYSSTVILARAGSSWLARGTAATTQRVRAPISCSTTASSYRRGTVGNGVCVVRNLPVGTVVRLRYLYRGAWNTLANGRTTSTVIRFTFRFLPRGTYSLQVTVGANRVYVATASRLMKIVIV